MKHLVQCQFDSILIQFLSNDSNHDSIQLRRQNMQKRQLVDEVVYLTQFITALQSERSSVAQALFISMSSGMKLMVDHQAFSLKLQ